MTDCAALRISVMQWRLEVILSTVQHNECSYGFWEVSANNKGVSGVSDVEVISLGVM